MRYEDKGKATIAASGLADAELAADRSGGPGACDRTFLRDRRRPLPRGDFTTLRRDPRHSGRLSSVGRDVVAPPSAPEARAMTSDVAAEILPSSCERIEPAPSLHDPEGAIHNDASEPLVGVVSRPSRKPW